MVERNCPDVSPRKTHRSRGTCGTGRGGASAALEGGPIETVAAPNTQTEP